MEKNTNTKKELIPKQITLKHCPHCGKVINDSKWSYKDYPKIIFCGEQDYEICETGFRKEEIITVVWNRHEVSGNSSHK